MNKNENKEANLNLKKGFFKRLFDYLKAKKYENNLNARNLYLKNWEKIKWRYRFGKLSFLLSFIFIGKYFCFDRIINENKLNNTEYNKQLKNKFEEILFLKSDNNFASFFEELKETNKTFFDLNIFEITNNNISINKHNLKSKDVNNVIIDTKVDLTKDIVNHLFKVINLNNENFKILKIEPKANLNELDELPADVQQIFK